MFNQVHFLAVPESRSLTYDQTSQTASRQPRQPNVYVQPSQSNDQTTQTTQATQTTQPIHSTSHYVQTIQTILSDQLGCLVGKPRKHSNYTRFNDHTTFFDFVLGHIWFLIITLGHIWFVWILGIHTRNIYDFLEIIQGSYKKIQRLKTL